MTKTKRQLRAEAVERLNEVRYGGDAVEFCEALLGERWSGENLRERIADLLTDDELPEGDAVSRLREWLVDEVNENELKNTWFTVTEQVCKLDGMLDKIADMVERDYVPRWRFDELADAYEKMADLSANQAAELNAMTAERDEWKAKAENVTHDNPYVGLIRGKSWERKQNGDYYCGKCGWKVTDHDSYCPECGGALHEAPKQPTSQSDAPKSEENAENGASKCDIRDFDDSREKLEDDMWRQCRHFTNADKEAIVQVRWVQLLGWLDRQAAITEREWESEQSYINAGYKERIAELEAERDYWRHEVQLCMDSAYPSSHSPEPPYAPKVMDYPTHDGYTTPSTLVSCVIDGLRDAAQDGFFKARFGDAVRLMSERDEWKAKAEQSERAMNAAAGKWAKADAELRESSSRVRAGSSNLEWLYEHDMELAGYEHQHDERLKAFEIAYRTQLDRLTEQNNQQARIIENLAAALARSTE